MHMRQGVYGSVRIEVGPKDEGILYCRKGDFWEASLLADISNFTSDLRSHSAKESTKHLSLSMITMLVQILASG